MVDPVELDNPLVLTDRLDAIQQRQGGRGDMRGEPVTQGIRSGGRRERTMEPGREVQIHAALRRFRGKFDQVFSDQLAKCAWMPWSATGSARRLPPRRGSPMLGNRLVPSQIDP